MDDSDPLFTTASRLHAAGRLDEVRAVLQRLLADQPGHAAGLNLMGIALGQQGDLTGGCGFVEQAIAVGDGDPIYWRNLCELRRLNDDPFRAMEAGRHAVEIAPDDRIARLNCAMAEQDALELDAAAANADAVLAAEPENGSAHFLRAQLLLMRGAWAEGWREYGWRWQIPGAERPKPATESPEWDGAAIAGTLLLIADQGFGDIIQFSRYLPWARARCGALVVALPRELRSLLQRLEPEARMIVEVGHAAESQAHATFSSLPGLAGTTADAVPGASGYLTADPERRARWKRRLDQLAPPPNRRIGIAWAGRREHRADRMRSMPLATYGALLRLTGVTYVSVQKGEGVGQVGGYFGPAPLVNLGPELEDFDDTAAVLCELDGLVTVDTSVAHLSGALGRPAEVILPYRPDWRWLLGRADTPWYDSLRLWRDETPGTRAATVGRLVEAVARRG